MLVYRRQDASVSQGSICSDKCVCCHTDTEVADQSFYLIQPLSTDTRQTSPNTDPIPPAAWEGSHWSTKFYVTGVCLFVSCLTSQQHASVSQGRICSDDFTCCHTEIEVADQTFYSHPVTVH